MAQLKATAELSPCTLFVRGIPSSCSNETLSEVFSKAGPIKECFVVKYKNSGNVEKPCIGYVTYSSPNDAKSALRMEADFAIDNSKLKISFARRKISKKRKITEIIGDDSKPNEPNPKKHNDRPESNKQIDVVDKTAISANGTDIPDDSYTVQISGLPALYSQDHVLSLWKKFGLKQPQSLLFPCENFTEDEKKDGENDEVKEAKDQLQTARFIVESKQAALKAYNKLSGKVVGKKKNYTLKVTFLTPEGNFKAARKSRLIVRNVSFQCTEDDLKEAFNRYGTVTEVKIATKPDGKKKGFAFVQFTHVFEATKAIKAMNMQEIKGRKVVIDWSLPKEKYKEMNENSDETKSETPDICSKDEETKQKSGEDDDLSESGDDVSDGSSSDSGLAEDDDDSNSDDGDDSNSDDDDDNEEEMEDDEEVDQEKNPYSKSLTKVTKVKKNHNPKTSHDVHEGRTVFIQNLSYDTTEEQLSEALEEYGELKYAKIVLNRDTGMSKGCGFVQFKTKEDAQGCIDAIGGDTGGRMLDGREIKVVFALSRGDTDKLLKEGKKKKKEKEDKRNLHLGREGLIRAGTQAAEGLSEVELKRRQKIENAKRAKLKNPNVFVSTTRLCIHNLPKSVDDAKLRELLMNQVKNQQGVRITECRIMRDMKNLNEKGVGRPLGYAFVNFTKHEHALTALRGFNNNPDIFGPIKRPIVEFSLENKKALEIKEKRKKKFVSKQKLKEKLRNSSEHENKEEKSTKLGRRKRQNLKRKSDNSAVSAAPNKRQKIPDGEQSVGTKQQGPSRSKSKLSGTKKNPIQQGERFPFQGSVSTTKSGKKLPLPSHSKPKIRQKNKGKILDQMRRSKKLNSKAAQRKVMQRYNEKKFGQPRKVNHSPVTNNTKPSKKKKNFNDDANFDALVSKYTKALSSKLTKTKKSGDKWYE